MDRFTQPDTEDVLWCRPDQRGERPRARRKEERRKPEDRGGRNGSKKSSGPTP